MRHATRVFGGATLVTATFFAALAAAQGPPSAPPPGAANAPAPAPAAVERAAQILGEVRAAMGGEKLSAITTILTTGRTRRVRGDNLVPIEFEIAIELPDKYVRKDEVPAEESEPTSTGFAGEDVIQFPLAPAGGRGRPGGPPPPPAGPPPGAPAAGGAGRGAGPGGPNPAARLMASKQEFARLALGLLPGSLATYPMTFSYVAQAAAPQGTADVLDVRGAGNFAARLFILRDTHLPVLLTWQAPPSAVTVITPGEPAPRTIAPGAVIVNAPAPPARNAPQEERDAYAASVAALRQKAQATPVEHRLFYADYRDVEGVKLPFRLRRAIGADTTEETTFDRFRLNTRIDPRKFTVGK
jgi:hypothetical protein